MPGDFIPRTDGDFSSWAAHFRAAIKPWWESENLPPELDDALNEALGAWQIAYPAHIAAQAAAASATQTKRAARAALESAARAMARIAQSYPTTTDALRADFGITVPDLAATPAPAPTTAPQASIRAGSRLTHTLRLADSATPTRTKKPRGVHGAEVWRALAAPGTTNPPPPESFAFLTTATRPTVRAEYSSADGGKTAVYILRWISTRGQPGPWSEPCTATVAA